MSGSTPEYWTRSDGVKFYTIGIGEFLMDKDANTSPNIECSLPGAQYKVCHVRGASENSQYQFTLFKGSEKYNNTAGAMSSVALFEKFLGGTPTQTGKLTLYGCSLDSNFTTSDCSASRISDIVSMNIKVSSAVVGTTSSPVSRTTQIFKGVDL